MSTKPSSLLIKLINRLPECCWASQSIAAEQASVARGVYLIRYQFRRPNEYHLEPWVRMNEGAYWELDQTHRREYHAGTHLLA